jgi:hypothetical protein
VCKEWRPLEELKRVVAEIDEHGRLHFTNAYSGNNGRAAILNDSRGHQDRASMR